MLNKKISTLVGVLIIVLWALGVVGIIFFLYDMKEDIVTEERESLGEPIIKEEPEEIIINKEAIEETIDEEITIDKNEFEEPEKYEFEDWQTYSNEEYGFEIKYPKGWTTSKEECGYQFRTDAKTVIRFENDSIEKRDKRHICIDVAINKDQLSLEEYFGRQKESEERDGHVIYFPFVDLKPKEEIIINGQSFYEIWIPGVLGTRAIFTSYKDCRVPPSAVL